MRGGLEGPPPAFIVTAEFDPLRDEGIACEALAAAGVPVEQLQARGHFHSSLTMVDVIAVAVSGREKIAQALQRFAGLKSQGSSPVQPCIVGAKFLWRALDDFLGRAGS